MRRGSKYDALRDYLSRDGRPRISLSVAEIEDVLGFELCGSAASPSWWANTKSEAGRAQRHAWRDAGYDAFLSADGETVEFARTPPLVVSARSGDTKSAQKRRPRHTAGPA